MDNNLKLNPETIKIYSQDNPEEAKKLAETLVLMDQTEQKSAKILKFFNNLRTSLGGSVVSGWSIIVNNGDDPTFVRYIVAIFTIIMVVGVVLVIYFFQFSNHG